MTRLLQKPAENRKSGTCRVLVLSPTRELAIQIHKDAEALSQHTSLHNVVIFGGMDHKGQRESLQQGADILIGTPGRILDYSRSGHLDLSQTEILVIDEADRMLDMGFIPDVRRIVSKLPPAGVRQTMLFSATLEPEVLRLADAFLKNPEFVESEPEQVITDLIDQHFYAVLSEQKLPFLLYLIRTLQPERLIIFGNMKHHNRDLVRELYSYGVDAELLSGDVPQEKRIKEMVNLNHRWFMQTLLDRKDRMSMFSGLEVRVPFCDHRIAEYLYGVPWEFKEHGGREKGLLRYAMRDWLPEEVLYRKKSPYPKTFDPRYLDLVTDRMQRLLEQKDAPVFALISREKLRLLLEGEEPWPWYGQLMRKPQTLAYFLQLDFWLRHYQVALCW
jgi:hypothetical protein